MKHLRVLAFVLLPVMTTGCFGRAGGEGLLLGAVFSAAMIAHASNTEGREYRNRDLEPNIIYVASAPPAPLAMHPAAPAPRAPALPAPRFDAQRARAALAEVDLTSCRESGAPRGYGHAKVTLNPSGDISKVIIDAPGDLSAAAAACIGRELGRARVPEFDGSLVTVGTTWFVP